MSNKIIITIGREFGSEGHEIGKELAKRLDIPMYDKDLLSLAAKRSGIAVEQLAIVDETITNRFLEPYLGFGMYSDNMNDKLVRIQSEVIRDVTAKESCIIIGRMADYILKDNLACLKVFIYAPLEERVKIIKEKHKIKEEEARKLVKKMDQARKNYYAYYSNNKWNQKEGKDILLNRATFGVQGCVDILEAMAKNKKQKPIENLLLMC